MDNILSNKDITNIKIYISKKINNEDFWFTNNNLISANEVNSISRISLFNKYAKDYLDLKYPQISNDKYYKHLVLTFIDKAIVKFYFVKYNKIILKSNSSADILRQNFKDIERYPYMKNIKYVIDINRNIESCNKSTSFVKATDKQLYLMFKLISQNSFLHFDSSKKNELTIDECSEIISYLNGKKDFLDNSLIEKYFKNIYSDSLYEFLLNPTLKEKIKNMVYLFLIENDCFYVDNELISQKCANELSRIDLAHNFYKLNLDTLQSYIDNNKSKFIIDTANLIDRLIPKIYYIIYNNLYNDEVISEEDLDDFNYLNYEYTMELEYQLNNCNDSKKSSKYTASVKQIEFIYKLLEVNKFSLTLKDHRTLTSKDASKLISMLKTNKLPLEYKQKYFEEKI